MKPIKKTLALAALAGLLAVPATRTLFAADGQKAADAPKTAEPPAVEIPVDPNANKLTDEEKAAGWKLLFDGKDTEGWHSYKKDKAGSGWAVKDGILTCEKPGREAGDLCTNDKYTWFELSLEYNISHAGNSGILFHVTDAGGATWSTGPEFQLEDNTAAADPIRCGWLYALYQPPIDPKTNKTLDATKPVGEWNKVRLLVSKDKCEHDINGVKYFEYVLNSEDFNSRVEKSKFNHKKPGMANYAKFDTGYLVLQGDHGKVSFRNVKVRPIEEGK
jgi:hypothetical protein